MSTLCIESNIISQNPKFDSFFMRKLEDKILNRELHLTRKLFHAEHGCEARHVLFTLCMYVGV